MKWLTITEAKAAAKKSKRAAIASCKKHWKQNYTATKEEIGDWDHNPTGWGYCALCHRHERGGLDCDKCPIGLSQKHPRCCKEYAEADDAFREYESGTVDFTEWQKKAKLMYEKLCSL